MFVIFMAGLFSCTKETSVENDGTRGPALGTDCRVSQIVLKDTATGLAELSILTRFAANGRASAVEVFDSLAGSPLFDVPLLYFGDTVRVAEGQFVLDGTGRVKSFLFSDSSGSVVETFRYDYTYDANGYLSKKELFSLGFLPNVPLVRFTYAWAGQNLTGIEGKQVVPGFEGNILKTAFEYDPAQTVKNFLPYLPESPEATLYLMALDFGKKPRNLLKRMRTETYDDTGMIDETLTTEFSDPYFSSDGYLLEWTVVGDEPLSLPFFPGRNVFRYHCR